MPQIKSNMTNLSESIEIFNTSKEAKEYCDKYENILFLVGGSTKEWSDLIKLVKRLPHIEKKYKCVHVTPKNLYAKGFQFLGIKTIPCLVIVKNSIPLKSFFVDGMTSAVDKAAVMDGLESDNGL